MAWIWAALMPHPPIMVPEVGRGREMGAALTLKGASRLTEKLSALPLSGRPDCLVVLSPHQPYAPGSLFINQAPVLRGGLEYFGAPSVKFNLTTSPKWQNLAEHLQADGLSVAFAANENLTPDHGSTVPLYFLSKIFGRLPPVILASPIGLSPEKALALGRSLASLDITGQNWALLASGDLSHRLTPEAPAGYSPEGRVFDQEVLAALEAGSPSALIDNWPSARLKSAGECGFRSALTLMGLADGPVEILSYEGPFGVGYGNALWINPSLAPEVHPQPPKIDYYPRLARLAVERHLAGQDSGDELWRDMGADPTIWSPREACFVSIKNKDGSLRGCIGTILPTQSNLAREIMANAVSAATRDPRFPPLTTGELDEVVFSVDVLSPPEKIDNPDQLDPARWGVIISKGPYRGLLLPDLEGVDTVEKQLAIAAQKAGLTTLDGATLERFSVTRYGPVQK